MGTTKITAEPGTHQIIIEREFDAPAEVVFRAHHDADLLKQWMGPAEDTMEIPVFEVHNGGRWEWVFTDKAGGQQSFRGVYHGDPSPEGFMSTFEWLGPPGHVSFNTYHFTERDGRTLMRSNAVFQSVEDRDGMIAAGMEVGMNEGYAKLDHLLTQLSDTTN